MAIEINFPATDPSDGASRQQPSDEELDELFARIGAQLAVHPMLLGARMLLRGIGAFMSSNRALVQLLIEKGVLDEDASLEVRDIAENMDRVSNERMLRDFMAFAARGLLRINGKPIPPDDAVTVASMLISDDADVASGVSAITRRMLSPGNLAALYEKAKDSADPLGELQAYRLPGDPEAKLKALSDDVVALKAELVTMSAGYSTLVKQHERDLTKISKLEKEVERLRDQFLAFRR